MLNGMKDTTWIIGFDLGGTKMICALVDSSGTVVLRKREKTPSENGGKAVSDAIIGLIKSVLDEGNVDSTSLRGIGVAVPGIINREKGTISLTNIDLTDYPLRDELEAVFGCPVILDNDVNAGTWAEYCQLKPGKYRHVVGVFVGTGIGGALIINGQLYNGATGNAGEIGHMIIMDGGPLCGCGQHGCLEAFASRTAMAKDAVVAAAQGRIPQISDKTGSDIKKFKSSVFEKGLEKELKPIEDIVGRAAYHLGLGLANLAMILNPEVFIISGGFANRLGEQYLKMVGATMKAKSMKHIGDSVRLLLGTLGDDAVPLGAALLARDALSNRK